MPETPIAAPDAERTFYRFVNSDPPTGRDFRSQADKGLVLPPGATDEAAKAWTGISSFDSLDRARRMIAMTSYRFIASIRVIPTSGITYMKTFNAGHYTLWGSREDFLAAVVDVDAV